MDQSSPMIAPPARRSALALPRVTLSAEKPLVVVAMSGGVDSSLAAALLQQRGYRVIGITLQLYDARGSSAKRKGACCAGQDLYDAKRTARTLGIPHYVLDFEERFQHAVIDDFLDSYRSGETPLPCARCNQRVKFTDLMGIARELGAQFLATGHYCRLLRRGGKTHLLRALDEGKDQSYFLFGTTQEQLEFLRFPLGSLHKSETRARAKALSLPVYDKPDSQDICFVTKHYADLFPEAEKRAGAIKDGKGTKLGEHRGLVHYTIGQRKGLGLGGGREPLYVTAIDKQDNSLCVGSREELGVRAAKLREINFLGERSNEGGGEGGGEQSISVKFRSLMAPVAARLDLAKGRVQFATPQFAVASGQACVFYKGKRVLGGGYIAATEREVA